MQKVDVTRAQLLRAARKRRVQGLPAKDGLLLIDSPLHLASDLDVSPNTLRRLLAEADIRVDSGVCALTF